MSQKSSELIREAVRLMQSGNKSSAISTLERAVECDRDDADAWGILGSLLAEGGDTRGADCFKEYIRIRPESPDGYQQLLYAYNKTHRVEDALKTARRFTEVQPQNANAWAMLAALCVETADNENRNGGIDRGIEYYEKALEIDPNNQLARKVLPSLYATRGKTTPAGSTSKPRTPAEQPATQAKKPWWKIW